MLLTSQRTMYASKLDLCQKFNVPYVINSNTTLNEKFEIEIDKELPNDTYPYLQYMAIGTGGVFINDSLDGLNISKHGPMDGALFEHIPFIIREPDKDLVPAQREKYRLRKEETINGAPYICYYLKELDNIRVEDNFYSVSTVNERSSMALYNTNNSKILNPEPRHTMKDHIDVESNSYAAIVAKVDVSLSDDELEEINQNMIIMYGEDNTKYLSEIALCSGLDITTEETHLEAICVQTMFFVDIEFKVSDSLKNNIAFNKAIELSGMEPDVL